MKTATDTDFAPKVPSPCILGIDPGLAHCGWGLISWKVEAQTKLQNSALCLLACGEIQTNSQTPLAQRLYTIYQKLTEIYLQYQPSACAVEELYFNKNSSSALAVAHARGIALLCAAEHKLSVYEFSANRIKQAVTGHGKASKQQVQEMVTFLLGCVNELRRPVTAGKSNQTDIDSQLYSNHAADALATAICLVHQNGLQITESSLQQLREIRPKVR